MPQYHNHKYLKQVRKDIRNSATPAEMLLWKALQSSKLGGRKFRRQHSIGNYIVDFYCPSERLVIELDGAYHYTVIGEQADMERDAFLKSLNIRVLRFENNIVLRDLDGVLYAIENAFIR